MPDAVHISEILMESNALTNSIVIEQFLEKAKKCILADLEADVRVRPIRVSVRHDVATYHALRCATWSHFCDGAVKAVEQLPVWCAFQTWLAERHLQASWVFSCDKAGMHSWWELTTAPMKNS